MYVYINEIDQIINCLYRGNEITKEVYNNAMNLIQIYNKMDAILMDSENSKICDPHRISLNISDKMNLKQRDEYKNLSIYYTRKNI